MVAKAEWLTIEPDINLASYLAGEDGRFEPSASNQWLDLAPEGTPQWSFLEDDAAEYE
jgi:hypothetical protein